MEKVLRSFIHEHFSLDIRVKMELIGRRRDIRNKEKQEEIIKLLQSNGLDNFVKLGPGTNRYAFKLDGFVVKIATDRDGKIDNMKEFKMAKRLFPYVAKTYEVSKNGSILIAEYIQPFASYAEMIRYADKIRAILNKLSSVYLIGDVGISSNNFANWGVRPGYDDPVCLDFAYVYEVSSSIFTCRACKSDPGVLIPDKDYNMLYCSKCNTPKRFEDLRGMISNDLHEHEIGDLSDEGYLLSESNVLTTLDPERSNYLINIPKNKRRSIKKSVVGDTDILDDNIKEENEMNESIKNVAAKLVDEHYRSRGLTIPPQSVMTAAEYANGSKESELEHENDIPVVPGAVLPSEKVAASSLYGVMESSNVTLAFSGKVDNTADSTADTIDDIADEMDIEDIDHDSIEYISTIVHPAISKICNRMLWDLKNSNMFDICKQFLRDKRMMPKAFYDAVQGSMWKSLGAYLGCEEVRGIPNRDNEGKHSEWVIKDPMTYDVSDDVKNSLLFIARMFDDQEINNLGNNDDGFEPEGYVDLYFELYDDTSGISHEWVYGFSQRLTNKISINQLGVNEIIKLLEHHGWVDVSDGGEDDEEDSYDKIEEEIKHEIDDLQSDEDEDDDDGVNYVSVDIVRGDKIDTIKLSFNDYVGYCSIPYYTKLDEISIEAKDLESPVDDRNGHWDWLRHIAPDIKFYTEDPDKYLECNDPYYYQGNDEEYETHIIILSKNGNKYLMGGYLVSGIFDVDSDGNTNYIDDLSIYGKINKMIRGALEMSPISHYVRSISEKSDVKSEEYVVKLVSEEDTEDEVEENTQQGEDDMEEENIDYSESEETVEEDQNSADTSESDELSEQEKAALDAMGDDTTEEDDYIRGFLVEERRNKKVNRSFYYDENHIEKIEGEKGKTYIDISGNPSFYGLTFRWNERNFVPNGKIKTAFEQSESAGDKGEKNPDTKIEDDDELPVIRRR